MSGGDARRERESAKGEVVGVVEGGGGVGVAGGGDKCGGR